MGTLLAALVLPASAAAQATRTWISGTGDDVNPCSRTAPCKTWAGAISKTATGGEVDALDPGGFGGVNITKAITLNGAGTNASVIGATVTVAAPSGAHVVLNDISFEGAGTAANAIRITSGSNVRLLNSDIEGYTASGIDDESTVPSVVDVDNTSISGNGGDGVLLAPAAGIAGSVTLSNDQISSNACGVVTTSFGVSGAYGTNCGVNASGTPSGALKLSAASSTISGNSGAGVLANGSTATEYISQDTITGNAVGLEELAGGHVIAVGTDTVFGNGVNGSPTSTQSSGQPAAASDLVIRCTALNGGKAQECTGKLVPAADAKVKMHGRRAHATLSRHGNVCGVGAVTLTSRGSEAVISPRGHVKPGRYKLTLRRNGRVVGVRTVVIR